MRETHLELSNGLRPPLPTVPTASPYVFSHHVEALGSRRALDVSISGDGQHITVKGSFNLDPALESQLSNQSSSGLSDDTRKQILKLFVPIRATQQEILNLIAQELERFEARKLLSGTHRWSVDGVIWSELSLDTGIAGLNLYLLHSLDPNWQTHVQLLLTKDERPFLAFQYLHEARRSQDRSAWINATIAAEMAIKEALTRIEPRLSALLFEVPSPPLSKLYGSVLESAAGERSPYVKLLQKGAEIRNRLVHRPEKVNLDPQKVVNYVNLVEEAIWHLIRLCIRSYVNDLHSMSHARSARRNAENCDF